MGIQALFQRKKKKNEKEEVKAESFVKDSEKEEKLTVTSTNEVDDLCDQVIDASYHGEDLKKEYQLVTDYLTDIQKSKSTF